MKCKFFLFFLLILPIFSVSAQERIVFSNPDKKLDIGNSVSLLEDKTNSLTVEEALKSTAFVKSTQQVPNLEVTHSSIWVRFDIQNTTEESDLALELSYATIDSIMFVLADKSSVRIENTGEYMSVNHRKYNHQDYIFDIHILSGESKTILLKINSSEQFQLPLAIGTPKSLIENIATRDLIFGLYAGLIIVMLLYNLFIYFTVRDRAYLYYVLYILSVGLTQACLQGYSARFLYPDSGGSFANLMMVVIPAASGMSAMVFLIGFMRVRFYTPMLYKVMLAFFGIYIACLILGLLGQYHTAAQVLQINVMLLAVIVVITGVKISRKGYRPAKFFMIA